MDEKNRNKKLILTASLDNFDKLENAQSLSEILKIPEKSKRQPDLTYMSAVLVSSGMNLNGAYFLPSEIISAFSSISDKPLDIEHEEVGIVGHLTKAVLVDRAGVVLDPTELSAKEVDEVNKLGDMDILVLGVVYKDRFPEVANEVIGGDYSISMECYYSHYDVIVGDVIIPADSAGFLGKDISAGDFDLVHGGKNVGTITIGRVLRNILFCGAGLVATPANPRSVILEAAAHEQQPKSEDDGDETEMEKHLDISVLPLSIIERSKVLRDLVLSNKELSFAAYTGSHSHSFAEGAGETHLGGGHGHVLLKDSLPDDVYVDIWDGGYHTHKVVLDSQKTGTDSSKHSHLFEVWYPDGKSKTLETGPAIKGHFHELNNSSSTLYGGSHSHLVEFDGLKLKTVFGKRAIKKFMDGHGKNTAVPMSERSGWTNVDGRPSSTAPGHCVNFKKYVYEFQSSESDPNKDYSIDSDFIPAPTLPGASDTIMQNMTLSHTSWCTLFDTGCTTLGGNATSGDCLRNVLNRTTRERITDDRELIMENRKEWESLLNDIDNSVSRAEASLNYLEEAEKWDRKYINDLPSAAFAVVESGYSEGKNKSARHLPHHNKNVKSATENSSVDLPHYRNALARAGQIKSVLKTQSDSTLRKKAAAHLEKHRAVLKKSMASFTPAQKVIWEECERLFEQNILPILAENF